jgi:hypothetical protein
MLSLLASDMIKFMNIHIHTHRVNKFHKVTGYKINTQKFYMVTRNHLRRNSRKKKTIPFAIA